jgi:hypothetical protein
MSELATGTALSDIATRVMTPLGDGHMKME